MLADIIRYLIIVNPISAMHNGGVQRYKCAFRNTMLVNSRSTGDILHVGHYDRHDERDKALPVSSV